MAATTELTPMASPVTQSTTAKAMVASIILSSRLIGPIFSSRSEAAAGALGVSLISGGHNCTPPYTFCYQLSHGADHGGGQHWLDLGRGGRGVGDESATHVTDLDN